MKKEEIENKDQELIKKFRTIIQNKKKKPAPRRFPLLLIFMFTVLIISSMLLIKQRLIILSSEGSKTITRPDPAPVPAEQPAPVSTEQSALVHAEEPDQISAEQPGLNAGTIEINTPTEAPEATAPFQKMVDKKTVLTSSDSVLINPVPEYNPSGEPFKQNVQKNKPSGIRIEEIISCSSVNNKQYGSPKIRFSLAQDATAKVWMNVVSQNPPFILTHVYYINEQKYCEVPLAIRYHRMRTWSSVTLKSADHIGRWRVEIITDSGVKLDQIKFTVVE